MTMQFNDEQLRTIVSKAIFDGLSPEKREEMMVAAIRNLMQPVQERYSPYAKRPSELEAAFQHHVSAVIHRIVAEWVAQPDVTDKIRQLVSAALSASLQSGALADAMTEGLKTAFVVRER